MARPTWKPGPTTHRVAAAVRHFREDRRLSVRQLSQRLEQLGHSYSPSAITKTEQGERRVDVDDLVALAVGLDVNPNALLLFGTPLDGSTQFTPNLPLPGIQGWRWATGELPIRFDTTPRWRRFESECSPLTHQPREQYYASANQEELGRTLVAASELGRRLIETAADLGIDPQLLLQLARVEVTTQARREAEGDLSPAEAEARLEEMLHGKDDFGEAAVFSTLEDGE